MPVIKSMFVILFQKVDKVSIERKYVFHFVRLFYLQFLNFHQNNQTSADEGK